MAISSFLVNLMLSIILTFISITAIAIVFRLFYGLICCINNKPKMKNEVSIQSSSTTSLPKTKLSLTTSSTNSRSKSNNIDSQNKHNSDPRGTTTIHSFFQYSTIICSTLFCVVCLCINMDRILLTTSVHDTYPAIAVTIWSFWFIGRMLLSLIFIAR
eukprot:320248_1